MEQSILDWLLTYQFNVFLTLIVFTIYFAFRSFAGKRIRKQAKQGRLKLDATTKALSALNILLGIAAVSSTLIVWGFDFRGLLTLSASILAVTGVALFAGWSVLSNVTAFFILLAHSSFRRGNFIRVIDIDNYVEGYISEINMFNTKLISENREVIIYPNNLLVARPMFVNPRERMSVIGKINEGRPECIEPEKETEKKPRKKSDTAQDTARVKSKADAKQTP